MQTLLKNELEQLRVDSYTTYQEENRIVFIYEPITDEVAIRVKSELSYFSNISTTEPIILEINSPGGSVSAGFAILDYCELLPNPIWTVATGLAASMGSFLLTCAGDKRYITKRCELLYHQPLMSGLSGQASDIEIHANHLLKTKEKIAEEIVSHSKMAKKKVKELLDRDSWVSIQEAIEYGLVDEELTEALSTK